jgi:transposase
LRGRLTEYGWVVARGTAHVTKLVERVEDPSFEPPEEARSILGVLSESLNDLDDKIALVDVELAKRAKADPLVHRLTSIPRVGPITATAIAALAPPSESFGKGRDFDACVSPTPLQKSTAGKQRLGATSKIGERSTRRLLIIGSSAVVRQAMLHGAPERTWLARILSRKLRMLVIVALANKMVRINDLS